MDKSRILELSDEEAAEIEAAIKECIAEVQRLREQMTNDQAEIDLLKAETRSLLADLKAA